MAAPRTDAFTVDLVELLPQAAARLGLPADSYGGTMRAAEKALRQGTFRAENVRRRTVNVGGRQRQFVTRSQRDRLIEGAVFLWLRERQGEWSHPNSYAYTPGRSGIGAIQAVAENGYFCDQYVKFDIVNFFDSVRHRDVLRALSRVVPDAGLSDIVKGLLTAVERPTWQGRGLGQGTVLAPLLGNLVLTFGMDELFLGEIGDPYSSLSPMSHGVDAAASHRLGPASLGYARYSDDGLVLVVGGREEGQSVRSIVSEALRRKGLRLRLRSGPIDHGFSFLGLDFWPSKNSHSLGVTPGAGLLHRMIDEATYLVASGREREDAVIQVVRVREPYLTRGGCDAAAVRAEVDSCMTVVSAA